MLETERVASITPEATLKPDRWGVHAAASGDIIAPAEPTQTVTLLRAIIETAPGLIYAKDLDSRMLIANSAALELIGKPWEEVKGRNDREFLESAEQAAMILANDRQVIASGRTQELEEVVSQPGGPPRLFLSKKTPLRNAAGRVVGLVGVSVDITDRKRLEQELQHLNATLESRVEERTRELMQAEEQLRQLQKMEAVGQLAGGLAHDFNNLLTGITGSMEQMQTKLAQGRLNDVDRYINVAQGAARRAATLTQRLLAFSRRQTLDPKPTNLNRLVVGMEELIRRTMGPSITVEVVGAAGLWPSLVDPNQLENALLNLCINARDAMPENGRLTIETGNKWIDQRASKERDLTPGQYVTLCVSDTGTGMTQETIERAFEPFFTTKPLGMGTGLGLSMVYGFAQQSGGQARIYSEVGQGTLVCLYLPRYQGDDVDLDQAAGVLEPIASGAGGKTVLVVDDEPTVRMLVVEVLEELGHTAIEAQDGAGGLRFLQSDLSLDLLITDVGLPGGMNGRQVADAGRAIRQGLKVLFITGYAENAVVGNGHLEPGMQVLTKPFAMAELASRIRDLLA